MSTDRDAMRSALISCLGGAWPLVGDLAPVTKKIEKKNGYRIESVTYDAELHAPIPAYLLIPDGVDAMHPAPAVAVWHQHNGQYHLGKSEPAGLAGDPMHHTGVALVREGYVVLCPDALCFEERRDTVLKDGAFERFEFLRYLVAGKCLAWKSILDMRRSIDYLVSRPEVDAARIGCYGHSMGSTHSWLIGPMDERIKAVAANCCLPTYAAIEKHRLLHCFPNFIPGWTLYGDTPDIASLIAPRALHINLGGKDSGSPIEEAREGIARIAAAYRTAGAAQQFTSFIEDDAGHELTASMWARVRAFFSDHLSS